MRLLAAGVAVLIVVPSALLARWLTVENAERDADLALIQAQARGDEAAMLGQMPGCRRSRACLADVRANLANPRLRRGGAVKILKLDSGTAYALGSETGRSRVAWTVIGTLPVVQCIEVHRSGNVLTGIHVELLSISPPIENEGGCTKLSKAERQVSEEAKSLVE